MTIKAKQPRVGKIEIDLTGPDGNAFALVATARNLARQIGLNGDLITSEMMLGDYEHLIKTFDRHFGNVCDLVR